APGAPRADGTGRRPPAGAPESGHAPENGRGFQEVTLGALTDLDSLRTLAPTPGVESGTSPAREDNSDLLVISGNSTASFGAGDWNDPQFRERMMEMANRMGFGPGEGGGFGNREGGFGPGGRPGEAGGGFGGPAGRLGGGGGPGFGG